MGIYRQRLKETTDESVSSENQHSILVSGDTEIAEDKWVQNQQIQPPSRESKRPHLPLSPGGPKKLCFSTLSLIPMVSIARLSVLKQSSFGLPGQYGRPVTRVNCWKSSSNLLPHENKRSGRAKKKYRPFHSSSLLSFQRLCIFYQPTQIYHCCHSPG